MKKTLFVIFGFILISCNHSTNNKKKETSVPLKKRDTIATTVSKNEEFKAVNYDELNQLLADKKDRISAKEVMKLFYPKKVETGEGNEKIEITEKTLNNGHVEITLIHDNLLDDAVRGEKYVMELTIHKDKWTVVSLKKNWKCWDNRGHTHWGIAPCG